MKSIGKVTSKALTDSNIGHKECELAINEERRYVSLKESIGRKKTQLGGIERKNYLANKTNFFFSYHFFSLVRESKAIDINQMDIKQNIAF